MRPGHGGNICRGGSVKRGEHLRFHRKKGLGLVEQIIAGHTRYYRGAAREPLDPGARAASGGGPDGGVHGGCALLGGNAPAAVLEDVGRGDQELSRLLTPAHHHARHDDSGMIPEPNDGRFVELVAVALQQGKAAGQLIAADDASRHHQKGVLGHGALKVIKPLTSSYGPPCLVFFMQETGGQIVSDRSHDPTLVRAPAFQKWCCSTQLCIVTAAAAEALSDRVEPNWLISTIASAEATAASERPGPSCPNNSTQRSGKRYVSMMTEPGTLSIATTGRLSADAHSTKAATSGWCITCW